MGINDEYSRDAYTYELAYDSEESDDPIEEIDPEDWQAIYADDIYDAWSIVKEFLDDNYILHDAEYHDFVGLVMEPWLWTSLVEPHEKVRTLWDSVSHIRVVAERVEPAHFFGWFSRLFNTSVL